MQMEELVSTLATQFCRQQVFGEPYERDGVTLIPVVTVCAGGGIGGRGRSQSGQTREGNGGLGVVVRPLGAWVIHEGNITWQPAFDLNRVIQGGQAVGALTLLSLPWLLRAWRRRV